MIMNPRIILRNEPFGGVYFNQINGRMVMVDFEGFFTFIKYLRKSFLNGKEKEFCDFFFNGNAPSEIELRVDPTVKFSNNYVAPCTNTPVLIDLSLNNYCNKRCKYCYMSAVKEDLGNYLSMEDFELLLEKMVKARVLQIALGGGEPTLHPHFPEILRRLREEGNIIPNYTTNGSNLTREILNASKRYCGAVAVSYSEERSKEVLEATKKLLSFNIQTNIHIVLLKSRIPNLAEITEQFAKLGVSNVVLLLFKPMGRGVNLTHELIDSGDRKSLSFELLKILTFKKKYGLRLSIDACSSFMVKDFPFLPESIEGCTGAIYSAYIDWDLNLKPCSFMQNTQGVSIRNKSIKDAWNSSLFTSFRNKLLTPRFEGCTHCKFFTSCFSGCSLRPDIVFCEEKGREINKATLFEEVEI